jgi:hypothetical protein
VPTDFFLHYRGRGGLQVHAIYIEVLADNWTVLSVRWEVLLQDLLLALVLGTPLSSGRCQDSLIHGLQKLLALYRFKLSKCTVQFFFDNDRSGLVSHTRMNVDKTILYDHVVTALSFLKNCYGIRMLLHLLDS